MTNRRSASRTNFRWVKLSDEELLDVRLCDLGVKIEGTALASRIGRLYEELDERGFVFRPHFWLSDEWFSPDGIPGVAIPFYLAHSRLARLERKMLLEVEGGTEAWCMKILRHEAGHTIDTAYRLHRRKRYREVFGSPAQPYPEFYTPKPRSRSYVIHIDPWYAQAHPYEDFAETFAVWLGQPRRWRTRYKGWRALKKLEYVDTIMAEIREQTPPLRSRAVHDPLKSLRKTLRTHYEEKRQRWGLDDVGNYDRDLRRLFHEAAPHKGARKASIYLRSLQRELRGLAAAWTSEHPYTIDQMLRQMIVRCRALNLYVDERDAGALRQNTIAMVTAQVMNHLHSGGRRIAL